MAVRIVHLGLEEEGVIEDVRDGGRTLIVAGERYTLRPSNAYFVRDGQPSYGTRIVFRAGAA
jgi:hypothetical protein